jgi:hypothetical protein
MFINWKLRELNLKIVYYGPAMGGKTTNLQVIHARTNPRVRTQLVSLKTREDRTIYFDFIQLELGEIRGLRPKFNLYTVPGQVRYEATRRLVLQGADGVVFVADSQMARMMANLQSFKTMHQHRREWGRDAMRVPYVVQFNKQDLPNLAPLPVLQRLFAPDGTQSFQSVANTGIGVLEALKATINLVVARAQRQL